MAKQIDLATAAALAAFKARGGSVTRVPTGASNGMTDRQWYRAARDSKNERVIDDARDEAIGEREREIAMAHGTEGVNDFRIGLRKHGAKAMIGW